MADISISDEIQTNTFDAQKAEAVEALEKAKASSRAWFQKAVLAHYGRKGLKKLAIVFGINYLLTIGFVWLVLAYVAANLQVTP